MTSVSKDTHDRCPQCGQIIASEIDRRVPRLGQRAEILAGWYFRYNGYFPLPNFIIHDAGLHKQVGGQLSDADLLAVRLPHAKEVIRGDGFEIVPKLDCRLGMLPDCADFVIAEVSSEQCKLNWLVSEDKRVRVKDDYLQYALRRFGYWEEDSLSDITSKLSNSERYEYSSNMPPSGFPFRIRLISVGISRNENLGGVLQITFAEILEYMQQDLFGCYGLNPKFKTIVSDHKQWDWLICQIYCKLLGHKENVHTVVDVLRWLFPNAAIQPSGMAGNIER
jgi:hypothetical protein